MERAVKLKVKDEKDKTHTDVLVDEPSVPEFVTIQPPKKRVLASIEVELSAKDFKRRLPKPVISSGTEVEP